MPLISRELHINATPERVFDFVSNVTGFSRHSRLIKSITEVAPGTYHWQVEVAGVKLSWDAVITESVRPTRFSWKSSTGLNNTGTYDITPSDGGSVVSFSMEYELDGSFFEKLLSPVMAEIMSFVAEELLENIRKELEG